MNKIVTGLSLIAVVAALVVACLLPQPGGAVYTALAGGRDVIHGHLARPDTWSFLTGGRVWVTPSWGSHVLFLGARALGGDTALLVFRFLLLAGIAAGITVAGRMRGASAGAAFLAAAAALAALPSGLAFGPRLVGFCCISLLLIVLYAFRGHPRRLWIAGLIVVVWANLHVSYFLGVAILVLWAIAAFLKPPAGARRSAAWSAAVAAGAAILTAAAGPFGPQNVLRPLHTAGDPRWREILGWRPLFTGDAPLPWVFLVLAGGVIVLGGVRAGLALARRRRPPSPAGAEDVPGYALFEGLLAILALVLPFVSRSFIPVAAIVLAPTAARLLSAVDRRGAAAALGALVLLGVLGRDYAWMPRYYDPHNPLRPPESLLARSLERGTQLPVGAGRFLGANGATGRIFHPPAWEGFLRWSAPGVTLFAGDRGGGIYDPEILDRVRRVLTASDPRSLLEGMDVHLVTVPLDAAYARFCQNLLAGKDPSWVYIYCDQRALVLGDLRDPDTRRLVDRTVAETLQYPDPADAALSRAMCLASTAMGVSGQMAVTALERAVSLRPTDFVYSLLVHRARQGGVDKQALIRYLEDQEEALEAMNPDAANGIQVLRSRMAVTLLLRGLYDRRTQEAKWNAANATNQAMSDRIEALQTAPWARGELRRLDFR